MPPRDLRLPLGIGAGLCDDDAETLVGAGGMMPLSPVDWVVAVLKEVENSTVAISTDVSISRLEARVADVILELFEDKGGGTPESPVVEVNAVLPDKMTSAVPLVGEGVAIVSLPERGTLVLSGGTTPESPVEKAVKVLLLVANEPPSDVARTEVSSEMFADRIGGKTPPPPVLRSVAVELGIVTSNDPAEVSTAGELVDTLELSITVMTEGGIIPPEPVDTAVYVSPEMVKFPLPDDTVGYVQSDPLDCGP